MRPRRIAGFTLIEVMVALVIVSLALAGVTSPAALTREHVTNVSSGR